MPKHLVAKLERRDSLSPAEKHLLENIESRVWDVGADEDIVSEGGRPNESMLLLDGFAARYKVLKDGKRQITAVHVVGDFVDLHSFLMKKMDHAVLALTPCKLAAVSHQTLRDITEKHPHLTRLLWHSTLIDSAIHREWLVAMGRRSATSHLAHFICEMFSRLETVGETEKYSFRLPLTQAELGDALGLSTVHVNRVLQELRAKRLIIWKSDLVVIEDWAGLVEAAEFDPTYLSLDREPR